MINKKIFSLLLMQAGFFIYSLYSLIGKFASFYDFLSLKFCCLYFLLIFILFIYAIIWQQVLKAFELSIATANKAITIIWGIIWGCLFFNEDITPKKIISTLIIISGILVLSSTKNNENKDSTK